MAPRKDIEVTLSSYGNYAKGSVTGSGRNHPFSVVGRVGTLSPTEGYTTAYAIVDGQNDFTGSRSGISGVQVVTHGDAIFHLQGGGTVAADAIILDASAKGIITPLSIVKVTAADSAAITVYR